MPKCMPIDTNQHTPTKITDGCQEIIKILADKKLPIDTNQHTPTKITDGCQEIIKILADKKTAAAQHAAMQYG